jgi:hypothetical protein
LKIISAPFKKSSRGFLPLHRLNVFRLQVSA